MKAGALYYALFVCLLIAIMLGTILLARLYQQKSLSNLTIEQKLIDNIDSGIKIALNQSQKEWSGEKFNLFQASEDTISIEKKSWGGYLLFKVTAYQNKKKRSRVFLTGQSNADYAQTAIIMRNKSAYLNLCGRTMISGEVNLDKHLIRETRFERKTPVVNKKVSFKDVEASAYRLKKEFLDGIDRTIKMDYNDIKGVEMSHISMFRDTIKTHRSFFEPTLLLYSEGEIVLKNIQYKGNIIICSRHSIRVEASAFLSDIQLYAPQIRVEDNFNGELQMFAFEEILIGNNCFLGYPSLACISAVDAEKKECINFGEGSEIYGSLIYTRQKHLNRTPQGIIATSGIINGSVISDAYVECNGRVNGKVVCNDFIYRSQSGIYENHLVDAIINGDKDRQALIEPVIFNNTQKLKVIDWLE